MDTFVYDGSGWAAVPPIAAMAEESTSNVSYVPYSDGDPSHGSEKNSADSDSSYTSSTSEDEATEKQVQMSTLASGTSPAKRKRKSLRLGGRKLKMLEIVFMTVAIVIVLGLFSLPAFYYNIHESYHGLGEETVKVNLPYRGVHGHA